MNERIDQELALLRTRFARIEYLAEGHWFRLPAYPAPQGIWSNDLPDVCFQVGDNYPGQKPYGFFVMQPFGLLSGGDVENAAVSSEPPFDGAWLKFSWDMPEWQAAADLASGYNLLNWALSFFARLAEGR